MSLGTGDPASETGDDSLSAITFDSDVETKTKRKSFHKPPPTSPKSPYQAKPRKAASCRSLRTAASMPLGNRMSLTPQRLRLGSSKPGRVPGTPIYREKEDMYDEIMELKKALHVQKGDTDLLRTKLRRLEEENARKDRQIEQLLHPSRGPDLLWTLAEKRPDAGWVINGLKQRVLRLEQQCRDKDSTISKLQTDMKTTNLEEMRIAMETYYEEIYRLQTLLASWETPGRKPPAERRPGPRRQKGLSGALLGLSRSVQELTEENQSLKEDLDRVLSSSPAVPRMQGYREWSKPRLLRRVAELEKAIGSTESPKPQAPEAEPCPSAVPVSGSSVHRQPAPKRHGREDSELRGAVRSLRGERRALQAQLQQRDVEVTELLQTKAALERELQSVREGETERRGREEALREEIQALTKKFRDLEAVTKKEEGDPLETSPETQEEPRPSRPSPQDAVPGPSREGQRHAAARTLQARWRAYRLQKQKALLDEAATVLQAAFRGHLARAKLLSSDVCGSGPPHVPSLPSQSSPSPCAPSPSVPAEDDPRQEAAITIIQSTLRAHLARVRLSLRADSTQRCQVHGSTLSAGGARRPASPAASDSRSLSPGWRAGTSAPAQRAAASPTPPAAAAGQEDRDVSSVDAVGQPAPEDGAPRPCRLGAPAAPQPCPAVSPPWGLGRSAPPPVEDGYSDDSDEVVVAPILPPAPGPRRYSSLGDALPVEG